MNPTGHYRSARNGGRIPMDRRRGYKPVRDRKEEKPGENKSVLTTILVVAIVFFLIISMILVYMVYSGDDDSGSGVTTYTKFMGGSDNVLINSTFTGATTYIELPKGAKVRSASMTIQGSLPPQRRTFQVGQSPIHVTEGDLDNDGYTDLAVCNYNSHTLMIMRNELGSEFVSSGEYTVGESPIESDIHDMDLDGLPDIVVLSEDDHQVNILWNTPDSLFRHGDETLTTDRVPTDLELMDANGDGYYDIVVTSQTTDMLRIFLNGGDRTFTEQVDIETPGSPLALDSGDIDGDGLADIVVSNGAGNGQVYEREKKRFTRWYSTISVFKNMGGGQFQETGEELRVERGAENIHLADINSDGQPDVIMPHIGQDLISSLLSDGSGWYQTGGPEDLDGRGYESIDPSMVDTRDFDNDGDLDILALSKSADSILYYPGRGDGGLAPPVQYYIGLSPTSFSILDFDQDGDFDVVTSDWRGMNANLGGDGTVSILENLRSGIFATYEIFPTGRSPRGIYLEDVDGDGDVDVTTANYFASTISILENNGLSSFSKPTNYSIGLEPYAVVIKDFDGDGNMDAASADEANFRIRVLKSDGKGGFIRGGQPIWIDIGGYPVSLRSSDIEGDGDPDLYTANYAQSSITLIYNDGSGNFSSMFSEFRTISLGNEMPYDIMIRDVNGDGLNDILTVNRGNDLDPTATISVMINQGDYLFENMTTYQVGERPTSMVLADMDMDGDLDVVTANIDGDSVTVMMNLGNGSFVRFGDYEVGDRPMYVNVFDYDSDQYKDLVVTNTESNSLTILRNMRGEDFKKVQELNIGAYPYYIGVDDLNGDGREDIALTSVNTDRVVVFGCYNLPEGIMIDVGSDGDYEYEEEGIFKGPVTIDITESINEYLDDWDGTGETVRVPIKAVCMVEGIIEMDNLVVITED